MFFIYTAPRINLSIDNGVRRGTNLLPRSPRMLSRVLVPVRRRVTLRLPTAPPDQRGRIMAFFSFSFMAAGLVGSLLNGYLVELFRAEGALLFATVGILTAVTLVRIFSSIWELESNWKQSDQVVIT